MYMTDALHTLARRIQTRTRYRRRRDRKIATDLLGKYFEYRFRNELTGTVEWLRFQLVAYNPVAHTVSLYPMWKGAVGGNIVWNTSDFWSLYRNGGLRDA